MPLLPRISLDWVNFRNRNSMIVAGNGKDRYMDRLKVNQRTRANIKH
jgi:hypothetical protein